MNRRLVVATMFVVLALLCLLLVGMSSAMRAGGAPLPHQSPVSAPQVAGVTHVPAQQVAAVGLMSGEFAVRQLA